MTGLVVPPGRQGPGVLSAAAVAQLDLAFARRAGGILPGDHRGAGVGQGTELAQIRPYEPGDDVRHIDPAASARTAVAHVRRHVPERALTTWLVLDVSPSMAFGTAVRLKSDVAEGVTGVIARLAVRRGGRIAVLTCGAPRPRLLPPRGGRRALVAAWRLAAEGVAPDGHADERALAGALLRVRRLAREPGLVVIVSDFRQDGWARALRSVAARHSILAVEISDPRERELPDAGQLVLVDPESGRLVEADTASGRLRERFAAAEARRRAAMAEALRGAGAEHVPLSTDADWLRDLARRAR
ncbi:MAG TPA: DUF58 domain-containing protein [Solirubrobacteraceae bacterium]|nr:DUF58 domain-containing protein [Solirubrobacteraceae bacterium]